jgi:hypothetical protein
VLHNIKLSFGYSCSRTPLKCPIESKMIEVSPVLNNYYTVLLTRRDSITSTDPLTLPEHVREIFVEKSLMDKEFVIGSAGSKYCGLKIKPAEIIKVVEATILDLQ